MRVVGEEVCVDLAIGIAVTDAPALAAAASRRQTAGQLIRSASENMHQLRAKSRGFQAQQHQSLSRLRLETDLRGALGRDEIYLHFQPQIERASGRVAAVEALAQWTHPDLGPVPPDVFVPIAEDSGLIREIGEHMLRIACRTVAYWRRQGHGLEVAVNVSAVQLADPKFTELVEQILAQESLGAEQ